MNKEAVKEALGILQEAFKSLNREEIEVVKSIQHEIDAAVQAGTVAKDSAKLEFCYTVKFSQDRIMNTKLLGACEAYIKAIEG